MLAEKDFGGTRSSAWKTIKNVFKFVRQPFVIIFTSLFQESSSWLELQKDGLHF